MGATIRPLLQSLVDKDYKVKVITNRKNSNIASFEVESGIEIHRVDDTRQLVRDKIVNSKIMKKKILNPAKYIALKSLGFFFYGFLGLFEPQYEYAGWLDSKIMKLAEELITDGFTTVLTISHPFKSHKIGLKLKRKYMDRIKWFMYEFDPLSMNDSNKKNLKRNWNYRLEHKCMAFSDTILLTPELYASYIATSFKRYESKMFEVPYPSLNPNEYLDIPKADFFSENTINCLFSGRLYEKIRSPQKAIEIFLSLDSCIRLYFMTDIVGKQLVKKYDLCNIIDIIDFLPLEESIAVQKDANIFVNIGNETEHQVPGKVFELMSLRKPIIHFCSRGHDTSIKYLKAYPLILFVPWNFDIEEQKRRIQNFCFENRYKTVSKKEIEKQLPNYISSYSKSKFLSILIDRGSR